MVGRLKNGLQRSVNFIRQADGSVRKLAVK